MDLSNVRDSHGKRYERIVELDDRKSGLKGFISLHNLNLGPALGGTRIFPYQSKDEALKDALRLSEAMTYKCAVAGLPFGGGKGVIIADPKDKNLQDILKAYAKAVDSLEGLFHTGEDVGLSEDNVQFMLQFSPYFIGKSHLAGDPSPFAAQSAFLCAQVAIKKYFPDSQLSEMSVAIKGLGKTGGALAEFYAQAGTKVFAADLDENKTLAFAKKYPNIEVASPDSVHSLKVDIYAPCALGNDITLKNLSDIKAKLIVGTANNQLESVEVGEKLFAKGIIHIPDYIANAGGLLDVADELLPGGFDKERVQKNIRKLGLTLGLVLDMSEKRNLSSDVIGNELAEKIFYETKNKKVLQGQN